MQSGVSPKSQEKDFLAVYDPIGLAQEFGPAIIFTFQPEKLNQPHCIDNMIDMLSQYEDLFRAYLYAMNEVLPEIRKKGRNNIKPEDVLRWMTEAHRLLAASMTYAGEGQPRLVPGTFANTNIIHWNHGGNLHDHVIIFLVGKDAARDDIASILRSQKVDQQKIQEFLRILIKIRNLNNVPIPVPVPKELLAELKLVNLNRLKLTADEFAFMQDFLYVPPDPREIPGKMAHYSQELVKKWRACDPANKDQVADLGVMIFECAANIHPFAICNKRMACWMLSVVLRSMNLPSLLMRVPDSDDQSHQNYNLGIECIRKNKTILKLHILERMAAAEVGYFQCEKHRELAMLSHRHLELLQELRDKLGSARASFAIGNIYGLAYKQLEIRVDDESLESLIQLFDHENTLLIRNMDRIVNSAPSVASFSILKPEAQKDPLLAILSMLEKISGKNQWKLYRKHATFDLATDATESDKLFELLKSTDAMQVERNAAKTIIRVSKVNDEKLKSYIAPQKVIKDNLI